MNNHWRYINGEIGWDNTVQVSDDGEKLLCKETVIEYNKLGGGIEKRIVKFFLIDVDTVKKSETEQTKEENK